jgi:hypothetical protein
MTHSDGDLLKLAARIEVVKDKDCFGCAYLPGLSSTERDKIIAALRHSASTSTAGRGEVVQISESSLVDFVHEHGADNAAYRVATALRSKFLIVPLAFPPAVETADIYADYSKLLSEAADWEARAIVAESKLATPADTSASVVGDLKGMFQAIYDLIDDEDAAEPLDCAIAHAKKGLAIIRALTSQVRADAGSGELHFPEGANVDRTDKSDSDGSAQGSRTWDVALSERVMQLEAGGAKNLSISAILGLIGFVRDGEGSELPSADLGSSAK